MTNYHDDPAIKAICREALKLNPELDEFWCPLSFWPKTGEPRLALCHYNEKFDPSKSAHVPLFFIRGPVVDLKTKVVIADSYGHTERLPIYSEITKNSNGKFEFQTLRKIFFGNSAGVSENAKFAVGAVELDPEQTTFYTGNEGVIFRVFKFGGKIFYSTQKTLYGESSYFGEVGNNFYNMYKRLRGPESRNEKGELLEGSQRLFRESHAYSPYCYVFLITDNHLRLASSVRDNRIIYLGVREMWSAVQYAKEPGDSYFCESSEDFQEPKRIVSRPAEVTSLPCGHGEDDKPLLKQNPITLEQANAILFPYKNAVQMPQKNEVTSAGASPQRDPAGSTESQPREIALKYDDNSQLTEVQYTRTRYETTKLGGGDFVVMYIKTTSGMFVYHIESEPYMYRLEVTKEDPNLYHNFVCRAPFFYCNSADRIKEEPPTFPVITGIEGESLDLGTSDGRLMWWNTILYECCRISSRAEVKGYAKAYLEAIGRCTSFILNNEKILDLEERKRLDERTLGRFENLRSISKFNSRDQPQTLILRSMLHRETGSAFYKMITGVKKVEELRKKRAQAEEKKEKKEKKEKEEEEQ